MKERSVGLKNYLAYGSGDFVGAGTTALTSVWLLYFYTSFCGIGALQASLIFAIARVFDAIFSPVMGYITDNFGRTRLGKRFGRRKFFILLGIPMIFSYSIMWLPGMDYLYYLLTYLLFDTVYSMILVPYETLVPEMTDDYKEKTKFSGARISFAQCSAILAGFLPGFLILQMGGKSNAMAFFYASMVFSVLCAIFLTCVYLFTWERPDSLKSKEALLAEEKAAQLGFKDSMERLVVELLSTFKIKIFRQHLGMYLGGYLAQDIFNAVFTYFVIFALLTPGGVYPFFSSNLAPESIMSFLSTTMGITQFIAVLFMMPICMKYGPAPAYRGVVTIFGLSCLGYAAVWLFNVPSDILLYVLLAISLVCGIGRGGINYVPWNIYTYIADVDEMITGKRREGIFAGVMTFTRKASQAGAIAVVGLLLDSAGFIKTGKGVALDSIVQPASVPITLTATLVFGTVFMLAIGFIISLKFKLNLETHGILVHEINNFKGIERSPTNAVSAENRPVIEMLTGMPCESLWGNNQIGYKDK